MKGPVLILLTAVVVLFGAGSTLAIMNNACKSSQHPWCVPIADSGHHAKTGHS